MYSTNNITLKPSKNNSQGFSNNIISNYNDDYILKVDVNSINFENISVELALNILRLNHTTYHNMSEMDIIKYYNEKSRMNLSLDAILALKIIIKSKLKNSNNIVNSYNSLNHETSLNISQNQQPPILPNYNLSKKNNTQPPVHPLFEINNLAVPNVSDNLNITENQVKITNFKIIQNDDTYSNNKTVMVNPYLKNNNSEQVSYVSQSNIFNQRVPNVRVNEKFNISTFANTSSGTYGASNVFGASNDSRQVLPNTMHQKNNNKFYDPPKSSNISYQSAIPSADYDLDSIINNYQIKKQSGVLSRN